MIHSEYIQEAEEREEHVSAIQHCSQSSTKSGRKVQSTTSRNLEEDNKFNCVSDSTVKLINLWLGEVECNQGFHIQQSGNKFEFLKEKDFSRWTINCAELDWEKLMEDREPETIISTLDILKKAQKQLKTLEGKLGSAQSKYRSETLSYLLGVNSIENFTKKVLPKARETPATHTEIWDSEAGTFRKCKNDTEELIATGQFHGNWMDASKAKEACAFATLRKEGLLGNRGISLNPDRKVTMADIPNLVHNGCRLSTKLKRAFVRAHGKHTARLFRPPKKDHEELYFPFFLTSSAGAMNEEVMFEKSYWKSLASIPGKARYNGFHMAVVGRFGQRWQQCLLDISKLILIMRYVPNKLKTIARFPIPKPGRVNEYRPISLCHDLYCFINAECTKITSRGIEKTNILHSGIAAYVKGRGCTTLVGVEQGVREDCIESGVPSSQTDEDEENFFDRIPVEVLLAAMRVNGFPEQGFLELKASGMDSKTVEIMTGKGVAHARFVCGIEQGNPDSPAMANLVIKFKHDLWLNILEDIDKSVSTHQVEGKEASRLRNKDAYRMHITDDRDGVVRIDRIGYCDDNTRYTSSHNEDDVIKATQFYIQQAGDLSLVTKIGRKGSKSEVHYFNISADKAISIKPIESIAWSFTVDGPQIEHVPHKMCLQEEELKQVFIKLQFHSLDSDGQQKILDTFQPKPHKHLGLKSNLQGNSSFASLDVLKKVKNRMASLKIRNMEMAQQKISMNILCNTVHSYAPLQMGHKISDLQDCDDELVNLVKKRHGLAQTDAKHILFIGENKGGYGIRSYVDVDVVANAREIEIGLNGNMIDSEVMRARTTAFVIRHNNPSRKASINYMGNAISKLARYGIHVRDRNDGIINYVLAILNRQKRFCTIGDERYTAMKNHSIGAGTDKNLEIAYGSKLHLFLRTALNTDGKVKDNAQIPESWKLPTSIKALNRMLKEAKINMFKDIAGLYNCWEWIRNEKIESVNEDMMNKKNWRFINVVDKLTAKFGKNAWKLSSDRVHFEATSILNNDNNGQFKDSIMRNESPIFVATDGSHSKSSFHSDKSSTTGAAVVCIMDIREGEALTDKQWMDRPALPVMARSVKAPFRSGNTTTDISHGEGIALCLGLEIICKHLPKIVIMDSLGVRTAALNIRDQATQDLRDRKYIRRVASGISKYLAERIELAFTCNNQSTEEAGEYKCKWDATEKFLRISKDWTNGAVKNGEMEARWKPEYWDTHKMTSILKVDSHQLGKDGKLIKKKPRYDQLCPNLFLLNCNHFADIIADMMHHSHFASKFPTSQIILPSSKLRFFLTSNGLGIDKHVSACLHFAFEKARIHELKKRQTQGLPWRIVEHSGMSWEKLRAFKGFFRSFRGLSRTHTRSLYKSTMYRKGWMMKTLCSASEEETKCLTQLSESKWINKLSACQWCANPGNAKGNRYHALLFCEERKLSKFRKNMDMLLEQKLYSFIKFVQRTQNSAAATIFLNEIENTMQGLHGLSNEGSVDAEQYLYWNRQKWIEEEGFNSEKELMDCEIPILGYIFGFHPLRESSFTSDKFLTPAMCIPLGIVPRELDEQIKNLSDNMIQCQIDRNVSRPIVEAYQERWKEIKEIGVAKIVGLHRIIGNVSSDYEKEFQKAINTKDDISEKNDNLVEMEKIRERNEDQSSNLESTSNRTQRKRKSIDPSQDRIKVTADITGKASVVRKRRKFCSGLTCNPCYKVWNFDFKKNEIESEKKHCQRCSRHLTALKKSVIELERCRESTNLESVQNLVTYLDEHPNSINYAAASIQISSTHQTEPPKERSPIKDLPKTRSHQKRRGMRDDQKTVLRTIQTAITRLTNRKDGPVERISSAIDKIKATHSRIDKFLKDDVQQTKQINKRLLSSSCDKKHTKRTKTIRAVRENEVKDDQQESGEDNKLREETAHTLGLNQWMYSYTMDRAVKCIRDMTSRGVFIANSYISSLLKNWNVNMGWQKIAEAFRSPDVILRKPDGTYIIPLFTGNDLQGHWSVAVVCKQRRSCRSWILDSMGSADWKEKEIQAIKIIFSNAKMKCRWIDISCRRQTEVECGSRSIVAMVSIVENLAEGLSVEDAVEKATLMHVTETNYDSKRIRQKAAKYLRLTEEGFQRDRERELSVRKCIREIRRKERCRQLIQQDLEEGNVVDLVDLMD